MSLVLSPQKSKASSENDVDLDGFVRPRLDTAGASADIWYEGVHNTPYAAARSGHVHNKKESTSKLVDATHIPIRPDFLISFPICGCGDKPALSSQCPLLYWGRAGLKDCMALLRIHKHIFIVVPVLNSSPVARLLLVAHHTTGCASDCIRLPKIYLYQPPVSSTRESELYCILDIARQ